MEEVMYVDIRHILAPTDFSACSKQAVDYAFALAKRFGAKLSLLHVIEPPDLPGVGTIPPELAHKLLDIQERDAQRRLAALLPQAEAAQVKVVSHVVIGSPYRKILETAAAENVGVIVMATHGRTGVSHLMMGSVAERIVRMATCPVLTLRPKE
jgi:nucleotide-binding universal stress UspA family protein